MLSYLVLVFTMIDVKSLGKPKVKKKPKTLILQEVTLPRSFKVVL